MAIIEFERVKNCFGWLEINYGWLEIYFKLASKPNTPSFSLYIYMKNIYIYEKKKDKLPQNHCF